MQRIEESDCPLFKAHTLPFLQLAREKMELARRLRNINLMSADDSLDKMITNFKTRVKTPFMEGLAEDLDRAMRIDYNTLLAFGVFNVRTETTEVDRAEKIQSPIKFYGSPRISKFQRQENTGNALFNFQGSFDESI